MNKRYSSQPGDNQIATIGNDALVQNFARAYQMLKDKHGENADVIFLEFAQELVKRYHDSRVDYLKFVFFPYSFAPVRPPSLFPTFSAIGKERATFTIGTGAGLTGGKINLAFMAGGNMNASHIMWSSGNGATQTNQGSTAIPNQLISLTQSCRVIAAQLDIKYIGKFDDQAGYWVASQTSIPAPSIASSQQPFLIQAGINNYDAVAIEDGMNCVTGTCSDSFRYVYTPQTNDEDFHTPINDDPSQLNMMLQFTTEGFPQSDKNLMISYCIWWEYQVVNNFRDSIETSQQQVGNYNQSMQQIQSLSKQRNTLQVLKQNQTGSEQADKGFLSTIGSYAGDAIKGVGSVIEFIKDNAGTISTIAKIGGQLF